MYLYVTANVDGYGLIGTTDEFVLTIKPYVENSKKVWKVLLCRKELGGSVDRAAAAPQNNFVAYLDDVISVQFRHTKLGLGYRVRSKHGFDLYFYPSGSLNGKKFKELMSYMISEGMPTRQTVPDYQGDDLPPDVEWGVEGNFVDLPLDRAVLNKASELLEAKLHLTPCRNDFKVRSLSTFLC
jgi:hypothetical protein